MTTRQITFDNDAPGVRLFGQGPRIINGFIDKSGALCRVPGYALFKDMALITGAPVTGVFSVQNTYEYQGQSIFSDVYSDRAEILTITAGGQIYNAWYYGGALTNESYYTSLSDQDRWVKLSKSNPVIFEFGKYDIYPAIIMADGAGQPVIYDVQNKRRVVDPEAPKPCSHVAMIDTYLIGNNVGEQYFDISYPGDIWRWDGDFAQAVSSSDDIMALAKVRRKLVLAGADSMEIWRNDGSTPFSPEYNHIEAGLSAKYSLINCDNTLYWLDKFKRIVACDIAQSIRPTVISDALNSSIEYASRQSYSQSYDCVGGHMQTDAGNYYIANFDNLEMVYAINTATGKWCQLGKWDAHRGEYKRFPLWVFGQSNSFGSLAGSCLDAKVHRVSSKFHTFDGDEIRSEFRSNIIRSAGSGRNIVKKLMVGVSRTADKPDAITIEPSILIRWRDDGATEWSMWREISISPTGRTEWDFQLYRCGSYRNSRQYEVVMLGDYPYQVSYIAEDV